MPSFWLCVGLLIYHPFTFFTPFLCSILLLLLLSLRVVTYGIVDLKNYIIAAVRRVRKKHGGENSCFFPSGPHFWHYCAPVFS